MKLLMIICLGVALLVGCDSESNDDEPTPTWTQLEIMEIAFEGDWSQEEIKQVIDEALTLYGLEITDENYSRAASALVTLRKSSENGVTEMEILAYMIEMHGEELEETLSFPDAAAFAFTFLETEPTPDDAN